MALSRLIQNKDFAGIKNFLEDKVTVNLKAIEEDEDAFEENHVIYVDLTRMKKGNRVTTSWSPGMSRRYVYKYEFDKVEHDIV